MALALAAAPPEPEFLDIDQPRAVTYFSGEPGERISQTFTTGPRTHLITAIAFQAWQPTGDKAGVKLHLRRYAAPTQWESGVLLGSQVGTFTNLADGDWVRFEFDKPVPVLPNALYNVSSLTSKDRWGIGTPIPIPTKADCHRAGRPSGVVTSRTI